MTSPIIPERRAALDSLYITPMDHVSRAPEEGRGTLDTIAWLTGQPHTAVPGLRFVSRVLQVYLQGLDEAWGQRTDPVVLQDVKPLLERVIGTHNDGLDETRGYIAMDWIARTFVPTWLDATHHWPHTYWRDAEPITDWTSAEAASQRMCQAAGHARELRSERLDGELTALLPYPLPARDKGKNPIRRSDWQRGLVASRDIALLSAHQLAGDAMRRAAGHAAFGAALFATKSHNDWVDVGLGAALDAATVIAMNSVRADGRLQATVRSLNNEDWNPAGPETMTAISDAITEALEPTVTTLQASALRLVESMTYPTKDSTCSQS